MRQIVKHPLQNVKHASDEIELEGLVRSRPIQHSHIEKYHKTEWQLKCAP